MTTIPLPAEGRQIGGGDRNPPAGLQQVPLADDAEAVAEPAGKSTDLLALEAALVAYPLTDLGRILLDRGRLHEAEARLRQSLAIRQKTLLAGHFEIARSQSDLGECLTRAAATPRPRPCCAGRKRSSPPASRRETSGWSTPAPALPPSTAPGALGADRQANGASGPPACTLTSRSLPAPRRPRGALDERNERMRSSKPGLCAVLALLAVPFAAGTAAACPTLIGTETRTMIVSSQTTYECFFRPAPTNAMRYYQHIQRVTQNLLVEFWEQCDGSIVEVHKPERGTTTIDCFKPTNISCVGNQDWQPSPLCPF